MAGLRHRLPRVDAGRQRPAHQDDRRQQHPSLRASGDGRAVGVGRQYAMQCQRLPGLDADRREQALAPDRGWRRDAVPVAGRRQPLALGWQNGLQCPGLPGLVVDRSGSPNRRHAGLRAGFRAESLVVGHLVLNAISGVPHECHPPSRHSRTKGSRTRASPILRRARRRRNVGRRRAGRDTRRRRRRTVGLPDLPCPAADRRLLRWHRRRPAVQRPSGRRLAGCRAVGIALRPLLDSATASGLGTASSATGRRPDRRAPTPPSARSAPRARAA